MPGEVEVEKKFAFTEHTADIGVTACGQDLKETFSNAALALFTLITNPEHVRPVVSRDVSVTAADREALLVAWLNELIYVFEVDRLVLSEFRIVVLTDTSLEARVLGEKVDPARHRLKMAVKAATYHLLDISEVDGRYKASVILDI